MNAQQLFNKLSAMLKLQMTLKTQNEKPELDKPMTKVTSYDYGKSDYDICTERVSECDDICTEQSGHDPCNVCG